MKLISCGRILNTFQLRSCENISSQFNRLSSATSSSESNSKEADLELSYTTYPDQEHSVDVKKKPLFFLHGLFGAKGNLHSVCKHLSNSGRKIVAYDARNHGESQHSPDIDYISMANDLDGLITDLKVKEPVVMGHSMGGKTAMTFALTNPDKLSALVVVDVAPSSSDTRELHKYLHAMIKAEIPTGVSIVQARKKVETQLASVVTNRAILQFLLTNLREFPSGEIKWRLNLQAILNNFNHIMEFPNTSFAPFTRPTLFVFGANSPHYRNAPMDKIKALFPNAEFSVIPYAGHFVHADKPLEFISKIHVFLSSFDEVSH